MDKETLSKYGWVVIVIIVLVILMSFAAPFGQYFSDSTMKMVETLKNSTNIEQLFIPNGGENSGALEVVTNYTSAQIEADEHIYAIGKTQPEYVVAEFNDDYTEVTITKNGDESDGLMMDWFVMDVTTGGFAEAFTSPLVTHGTTLSSVFIEDGVVNIGTGLILGADVNTGEEVVFNINELCIPKSIKTIPGMSIYFINEINNLYYSGTANDWASISFSDIVTTEGVQSTYMDLHIDINWFSVLYYTNNVYFNNELVVDISFEEGLNTINAFSFAGYDKLETVIIPNSVKEIQPYAFAECSNLTSLNIPDGIDIWQTTFESTPLVEYPGTSAGGTYVGNYLIKASLYQSSRTLSVREGTTTIANDAGKNGNYSILPDDTTIPTMQWLYLPSTITHISPNAFTEYNSLSVYGPIDSYIEQWANSQGYTFVAM